MQGNKNTLTGIIDVAMIPTLVNRNDIDSIVSNYGMVIMDECQSAASNSSIYVMEKIKAKYIYGVGATIKRSDKLDKIIFMLLGPIRHKYTALQKAQDFNIKHYFILRFTHVVDYEKSDDINKKFKLLFSNKLRNKQIVDDVLDSFSNSKNILVITKYKEHTKHLYEELSNKVNNVYLIYGDISEKDNINTINTINNLDDTTNFIIVATGQKIGVGFNMPKLNTLFLATPVSDPSKYEQYLGRIDRIYKNKDEVYVYDYVDSHIPVFNNMYSKRLSVYKKCAYSLYNTQIDKQDVNKIYGYDNYREIFERDLVEARNRIIISSSSLDEEKLVRILQLLKLKLEQGIIVSFVLNNLDSIFNNSDYTYRLISKIKELGISVIEKDDFFENFCVIDEDLLWHGNIELIGKSDIYAISIRINDQKAVEEILELTFKQ